VCEISFENSERLLRKWQKKLGDTFLPHTVIYINDVYYFSTGYRVILYANNSLLIASPTSEPEKLLHK